MHFRLLLELFWKQRIDTTQEEGTDNFYARMHLLHNVLVCQRLRSGSLRVQLYCYLREQAARYRRFLVVTWHSECIFNPIP